MKNWLKSILFRKQKKINKKEIIITYIIDELSKSNGDINNIENFVRSLKKKQLIKLCKLLSEQRKNGVFNKVINGKYRWRFEDANIKEVYLRDMNPNLPRMKKALEKYNYNLKNFSRSNEAKMFKEISFDKKPERDIILAEIENNKIKIIDGCHRAIALAKKQDFIKLYVGVNKK